MPLLWCSISGHGFGHAAQVTPILNALGERVPDLRVLLRTTVPSSFFEARLTIPWDYQPAQQDIGCVQNGPLTIDVPATWEALRRFHADWDSRLREETNLLRSTGATLVLSDISYLAIAAAQSAGLPALCVASLAWDEIMEEHLEPSRDDQPHLLAHMRQWYGRCDRLIRIAPAMPLRAFPSPVNVGPIVEPLEADPTRLRARIGAAGHERVVLVGFGGVALRHLPYERMEQMAGYQFIVDGELPRAFTRIHAAHHLDMRFMTMLASCDIIMTKPGYSTIVEAVDKRKFVVYVRRYNFGDEQPLVEYLHRYGRGCELSRADFDQGLWEQALSSIDQHATQAIETPPLPGNGAAAEILQASLS